MKPPSVSRSTLAVWCTLGLALVPALASRPATAGPGLVDAGAQSTAAQGGAAVVARLLADDEIRDGIAPLQRQHIEATVAAYRARHPTHAKSHGPFLFTFFPQAGVPDRDLFLRNFTDLDPAPVLVRDWDCSSLTYDGHRGHDSLIRSFREQAIGVPVFAAHGGVVIDAHDGEFDMNTDSPGVSFGNYAIIDHGGGYETWYFHMRRGSVAVRPGQAVAAGKQIGLTASSGRSSWPHLHLETHFQGDWVEPSAGLCRPGESLWAAQPQVLRELYADDFYLSPDRLPLDRTALLIDEFRRAGSFVKGRQRIDARVDVHNLPAGATHRVRVLDAQGHVALESEGTYDDSGPFPLVITLFSLDLDLSTTGVWRFQLELDGTLVVDAPFRVVASPGQVVNRPPNKIGLSLSPAPVAGEVVACEVLTPLIGKDPDYDIVSYRYDWRSGSRLLRSVTSAGSTDLLAADLVHAGDRLSCRVTPSDGQRLGRPAVAKAVVAEE
jgi:peptidase M23-like protein